VSYFIEKGPFEYQNLNADFSLSAKYYEKDKTNRYLKKIKFLLYETKRGKMQ